MDDIDRVFARFKEDKPEPTSRRETLNIPRRNGASGSRTVEVVHLRSGRGTTERPQRLDPRVRAASWDGGFRAKRSVTPPVLSTPVTANAITPTTHVMPAWNPAAPEEASSAPGSPPAAEAPGVAEHRRRGRPRKEISTTPPAQRIADPFDADDDGANCMRCGYVIEPARVLRGLMTCADCG